MSKYIIADARHVSRVLRGADIDMTILQTRNSPYQCWLERPYRGRISNWDPRDMNEAIQVLIAAGFLVTRPEWCLDPDGFLVYRPVKTVYDRDRYDKYPQAARQVKPDGVFDRDGNKVNETQVKSDA